MGNAAVLVLLFVQVGALVGEAESEAARIAAAGKVTDEAKSAMQAALEQSSQIVDYNTHAAQVLSYSDRPAFGSNIV
jgi:septation ring formation regulator EzrA